MGRGPSRSTTTRARDRGWWRDRRAQLLELALDALEDLGEIGAEREPRDRGSVDPSRRAQFLKGADGWREIPAAGPRWHSVRRPRQTRAGAGGRHPGHDRGEQSAVAGARPRRARLGEGDRAPPEPGRSVCQHRRRDRVPDAAASACCQLVRDAMGVRRQDQRVGVARQRRQPLSRRVSRREVRKRRTISRPGRGGARRRKGARARVMRHQIDRRDRALHQPRISREVARAAERAR